jgi:hypothetical protein
MTEEELIKYLNFRLKKVAANLDDAEEEQNPLDHTYWKGVQDTLFDILTLYEDEGDEDVQ